MENPLKLHDVRFLTKLGVTRQNRGGATQPVQGSEKLLRCFQALGTDSQPG